MTAVDIPQTFGALLIGGLFATVYVQPFILLQDLIIVAAQSLTGAVAVQVVVYFKLYSMDPPRIKVLVSSAFIILPIGADSSINVWIRLGPGHMV